MTSDGTNCYTYNDANQLSKVTNCNSGQTIAQYVYDYQGNRIEKKVYNNNSLQQTVYTPNQDYQTVKLASNGATLNTSYYYVNDELAAQKNPDGSKYYFLSDNLGSTSVLTNQNGNVVENTTYLPFGQIQSGGTDSKYLYTGQQNDQETNLDYYNARYYDPSIQHFTQPDSELPNVYDPQQLNRYAYVGNNPMTVNDPTGHFFGIDDAIEIFVATAIIAPVVEDVATNPEVDSTAGAVEGEATSLAESGAGAVENTVGSIAQNTENVVYDASNAVEEGSSYTETSTSGQYNKIGSTGDFGQQQVEEMDPNATPQYQWKAGQVPGFDTARVSDTFNTETLAGQESKVGYQTLTESNQIQVDKDSALLNSGQMQSMTYQFFRSPVTGKIGPSAPYANYLIQNNIPYNVWDDTEQ